MSLFMYKIMQGSTRMLRQKFSSIGYQVLYQFLLSRSLAGFWIHLSLSVPRYLWDHTDSMPLFPTRCNYMIELDLKILRCFSALTMKNAPRAFTRYSMQALPTTR